MVVVAGGVGCKPRLLVRLRVVCYIQEVCSGGGSFSAGVANDVAEECGALVAESLIIIPQGVRLSLSHLLKITIVRGALIANNEFSRAARSQCLAINVEGRMLLRVLSMRLLCFVAAARLQGPLDAVDYFGLGARVGGSFREEGLMYYGRAARSCGCG